MKRVVLLIAIGLSGCYRDPISVSLTENREFDVEKLFTHRGCTVYRFFDNGPKYFTDCKGSTEWEESNGKTRTHRSVSGGGI